LVDNYATSFTYFQFGINGQVILRFYADRENNQVGIELFTAV
jgi:hypothetical protein